jgi:hypothetical protein
MLVAEHVRGFEQKADFVLAGGTDILHIDYGDQMNNVGPDGCVPVPVPDGPGLGVIYDWEKINAWETAKQVFA